MFYSFQVVAVGRLAKQPELKHKGETAYCNITLIGNDYAGQGAKPTVTTLFIVAFGKYAEALAEHTRKGDQLIVNAHIEDNSFQQGDKTRYGVEYILDSFCWGAPGPEKRRELARERSSEHDESESAPL